jgi:hypothetical protein
VLLCLFENRKGKRLDFGAEIISQEIFQIRDEQAVWIST